MFGLSVWSGAWNWLAALVGLRWAEEAVGERSGPTEGVIVYTPEKTFVRLFCACILPVYESALC
jgi:hypothetical protein